MRLALASLSIVLVMGVPYAGAARQTLAASVVDVAAGNFHTCAVLSGGKVNCWGRNYDGAVGDGTNVQRNAAVETLDITNATQVSARWDASCARLSTGAVKCWGANDYGQLGDGTTTERDAPVQVSGITTATQVVTNAQQSCALLSNGTVSCWGQLLSESIAGPALVSGVSTATQIAADGWHICARLSDGTVKCWGWNYYGQLGDNSTTDSLTPVSVSGISTATQVSLGAVHSCARLSDATVKCWGSNWKGQLGDGTTTDALTPVGVSGITTASSVSGGGDHSCARLSNSQLKCWGYNNYGQLGDGTTTDRTTPVAVSGVSNATGVAAGGATHTCAWLTDGKAKCWGEGYNGQLGDRSADMGSTTPVTVLAPDSIYKTNNYTTNCAGVQDPTSINATFCLTDNASLTYFVQSSLDATAEQTIENALMDHYHPTDLNVSLEDPPVYTGGSETDIIYQVNGSLPFGSLARTWCDDAISSTVCDQHYVGFAQASYAHNDAITCHETGHAVGLVHGDQAWPEMEEEPQLGCMAVPSTYTLPPHQTTQIDETY